MVILLQGKNKMEGTELEVRLLWIYHSEYLYINNFYYFLFFFLQCSAVLEETNDKTLQTANKITMNY